MIIKNSTSGHLSEEWSAYNDAKALSLSNHYLLWHSTHYTKQSPMRPDDNPLHSQLRLKGNGFTG